MVTNENGRVRGPLAGARLRAVLDRHGISRDDIQRRVAEMTGRQRRIPAVDFHAVQYAATVVAAVVSERAAGAL